MKPEDLPTDSPDGIDPLCDVPSPTPEPTAAEIKALLSELDERDSRAAQTDSNDQPENPYKRFAHLASPVEDLPNEPDYPEQDAPSRAHNDDNRTTFKRSKKLEAQFQAEVGDKFQVSITAKFKSKKTQADYRDQVLALEDAMRSPDDAIGCTQFGTFKTRRGRDTVVPNHWTLKREDTVKRLLGGLRDLGYKNALPISATYSEVYRKIRQCHIDRKFAKDNRKESLKLDFSLEVTPDGQVFINKKRVEIVQRNGKPSLREGSPGNYTYKSVDAITGMMQFLNRIGYKL